MDTGSLIGKHSLVFSARGDKEEVSITVFFLCLRRLWIDDDDGGGRREPRIAC